MHIPEDLPVIFCGMEEIAAYAFIPGQGHDEHGRGDELIAGKLADLAVKFCITCSYL